MLKQICYNTATKGATMGLFSYLINKNKNLIHDELQNEGIAPQSKGSLNNTNQVKQSSVIRLYYVALEKYSAYGTNDAKIGQTYSISSPFKLPVEMSIGEACKVISYLTEKIENENNLQHACEKSVDLTSKILSDYGFEKIKTNNKGHYHAISEYIPLAQLEASPFSACKRINGVVDLFTVGGDFEIFKSTDLRDRYFNWFTAGVMREEIEDIYKKIGATHLLPKPTKQEQNV